MFPYFMLRPKLYQGGAIPGPGEFQTILRIVDAQVPPLFPKFPGHISRTQKTGRPEKNPAVAKDHSRIFR